MDDELDYGGDDEDVFQIMVGEEADDLLRDLGDVPVVSKENKKETGGGGREKTVDVLERVKMRVEEDKRKAEKEYRRKEKEKRRREEERKVREEKRVEEAKKKLRDEGNREVGWNMNEPVMSGEKRKKMEEEKRRMEVMKKRRMEAGVGGGKVEKKKEKFVEEIKKKWTEALEKSKKEEEGNGSDRMEKKPVVSDGLEGNGEDEVVELEGKKKKGGGRLVLGHVLVKQRLKRKRVEKKVKDSKKKEAESVENASGDGVNGEGQKKEDDDKVGLVVTQDGDEEWMVEKILKKMVGADGVVLYRIKWVGWDKKFNTWEPLEHLGNCTELMAEFERKEKRRKLKRKGKGDEEEQEIAITTSGEEWVSEREGSNSDLPVLDYCGGDMEEGMMKVEGRGEDGDDGVGDEVDPSPPTLPVERVKVEVDLEETGGNEVVGEEEEEATEREQAVVKEGPAPMEKKKVVRRRRRIDWLERRAQAEMFGSRFRRLWRREETPLCVLSCGQFNGSLVLLVRLKPETEEETLKVLEDPDKDLEDDNTTYVYIPSKHFAKAYPQLLIEFYQSCFTFLDSPQGPQDINGQV